MEQVKPDRNGTEEQRSEYYRQMRLKGPKVTRDDLIKRFGSEEAMREHYRSMQLKSRKTYNGSGGLRALKKTDPPKFRKIIEKGVRVRQAKGRNDGDRV